MRRPRQFTYSWEHIAAVLGLTVLTAMRYGQGRDRRFDPSDMASVFAYAQQRRAQALLDAADAPRFLEQMVHGGRVPEYKEKLAEHMMDPSTKTSPRDPTGA